MGYRNMMRLLYLVICFSLAAAAAAAASSSSSGSSACSGSDDTAYSFPPNRSEDTLALLQDAEVSNGILRLITPAASGNNSGGTALRPAPVTLRCADSLGVPQDASSFETAFDISVQREEAAASNKSDGGGLAFVIVPTINGVSPPGRSSDGERFFAVVFNFSIDGNRVGVSIKNGSSTIVIPEQAVPLSHDLNMNATTNNYTAWINYKYKRYELRMSICMDFHGRPKPDKTCLEWPLNLSSYVPDRAFIGFSASSGSSAMALHRYSILSWDLKVKLASSGGLDIEWKVILPAVLGTIAITAIMNVIVAALYFNSKYRKLKMELVLTEALRRLPGTPREFKHSTMRKATNNFDEGRKLGSGGFGAVYRGTLRSSSSSAGGGKVVDGKTTVSVEVAVKKFTRDEKRCYDDFLSEVDIINRLRHRNVVPLVGWSYANGELLLIYEYMPNGSLDQQLFPKEKPPGRVLPWARRYSIAMDVAAGLHYVHHEHEHMVLHRDIKASNILLDSAFRARLGDFGLARVVGLDKNSYTDLGVAGTWGFIAPEYSVSHKATRKTDVYAFGVLLLEIVTGRRALCKLHGTFQLLADWVWRLHRDGALLDAVDNGVVSTEEFDADDATRLLLLGLACSNPNPSDRPSMTEVVQVVARSAPPPDVPLVKPAFVWPPEDGNSDDVNSTASDLDASLSLNGWEETSSSESLASDIARRARYGRFN
ncbi:probable L-type lectin-domain containing receptor kinase S.5 [Oryza brachyantha]|uniref:probable L-type lectin-domain containing receptor kinase S.5 n=1 Tax=Oryza brachyantha TaxID=4533 RepID=UPI0003EAD17F|nr:probable L-type lectin-domain containing receptor kinase S.5 [Oryza brachyantha]XP_015691817.1 probable L-type lectin-domain containing receptor kinase S.5 [Oryza brachyantha]XP_015691818.1 probable L-type lectin-domain containing receptor kinase S.5 [Oryza brachyantha]